MPAPLWAVSGATAGPSPVRREQPGQGTQPRSWWSRAPRSWSRERSSCSITRRGPNRPGRPAEMGPRPMWKPTRIRPRAPRRRRRWSRVWLLAQHRDAEPKPGVGGRPPCAGVSASQGVVPPELCRAPPQRGDGYSASGKQPGRDPALHFAGALLLAGEGATTTKAPVSAGTAHCKRRNCFCAPAAS